MKHLKKFENNLLYNEFLKTEEYIEPHVSLEVLEDVVNYNKASKNVILFSYIGDGDPFKSNSTIKNNPNIKDIIYKNGKGKIIFKNKVTSIEPGAFSGLNNLTSITLPDSITSIGSNAFNSCYNLTSINIPDYVTSIEAVAFLECVGLESINIPNSVTSIGEDAFEYTFFTKDTFINKSNLDSETNNYWGATICDTVIDDIYCIQDTSLIGIKDLTKSTYNIPDFVTSIESSAFYKCNNLVSINIPESVTSIKDYAFCKLESLTSVTIPNSVTSIGLNVFELCPNLMSIIYNGSIDQFKHIITSGSFRNNRGIIITCTDGTYDKKFNKIG